jgi:hypothetical protein
MNFSYSMDAKDFIVSRIVEEARRRHTSVSDLERKMLYFSEGYPTLPDMMEVAQEFEAKCDDEKYEAKIRKLSREAFERDKVESPERVQLWRDAIEVLGRGDHYISVMLDVPLAPNVARWAVDRAKLVMAALVVIAAGVGIIAAIYWVRDNTHIRIPDSIKLPAFFLALLFGYYVVYSDRGKALGDALGSFTDRVARWFSR